MHAANDDFDPTTSGSSDTEGHEAPQFTGYTREALDLSRAFQRALLRKRTRAALAAKRARGERVGNLPYGYRLAADGLHLLMDEAEQAVIDRVRQLSREGLSQRAIVVELHANGVVGRKGTPLQQTQIARLLRSAS
ncbi:MAG: Resolvase [Labilithrix sp.]|nr:Resolvase [Labilithrix sp.]